MKQSDTNAQRQLFDFPTSPFLDSAKFEIPEKHHGSLVLIGSPEAEAKWLKSVSDHIVSWQKEHVSDCKDGFLSLTFPTGPVWMVRLYRTEADDLQESQPRLNDRGMARNAVGLAVNRLEEFRSLNWLIQSEGLNSDQQFGAVLGLEMGLYRYGRIRRSRSNRFSIFFQGFAELQVKAAAMLGHGVNFARHLVNLPANELNPTTYAQCIKDLFADIPRVSIRVLKGAELKDRGCGLLEAVGSAAKEPPCILHLRYRPERGSQGTWKKPIALVGKGITFDTGGLDIKGANAMRRMKKDMGGSATLAGIALWAALTKFKEPLDVYLALAENAVGSHAFRPGDVFRGANGKSVEIHNTDAEGRLVLADALTLAAESTGEDEPGAVIDVATLTGAARVALGPEIGALFSCNSDLANKLYLASIDACDPLWQMPLYRDYRYYLQSTVADLANSASVPMGGSITAALFLNQFRGRKPWAHLDLYCWTDEKKGPYLETGGSGQGVQALGNFLTQLTSTDFGT